MLTTRSGSCALATTPSSCAARRSSPSATAGGASAPSMGATTIMRRRGCAFGTTTKADGRVGFDRSARSVFLPPPEMQKETSGVASASYGSRRQTSRSLRTGPMACNTCAGSARPITTGRTQTQFATICGSSGSVSPAKSLTPCLSPRASGVRFASATTLVQHFGA